MTLKNINDYDITILNRQIIDGEEDTIEEKTIGSFRIMDEKAYIMYKSRGEDGDETISVINVSCDGVKIKRKGAVTADMIYRTGEKTAFLYRLPFGAMDMEIYTKSIENSLNENGGTLRIVYTLFVQGATMENDMQIQILRGKNDEI